MNILIVDDDLTFRGLLRLNFEEYNFKCYEASNISEAQKLLIKQNFTHAILDLKMPGPSGLFLVPTLKQKNPEIKIVILTGYASHQTAVEAIKLGAIHYLAKPAEFEQILQAFDQNEGDPNVDHQEVPKGLEDIQKRHTLQILSKHQGNISKTAKELNIHRRTLQRKLEKWGER